MESLLVGLIVGLALIYTIRVFVRQWRSFGNKDRQSGCGCSGCGSSSSCSVQDKIEPHK